VARRGVLALHVEVVVHPHDLSRLIVDPRLPQRIAEVGCVLYGRRRNATERDRPARYGQATTGSFSLMTARPSRARRSRHRIGMTVVQGVSPAIPAKRTKTKKTRPSTTSRMIRFLSFDPGCPGGFEIPGSMLDPRSLRPEVSIQPGLEGELSASCSSSRPGCWNRSGSLSEAGSAGRSPSAPVAAGRADAPHW